MKTLIKSLSVIVALLFAASPMSWAATSTVGPVTVSAVVGSTFTLSVTLRKNSSTGTVVASMDFGTLQNVGTGTLRSSTTGSTGTGSVVAMINCTSTVGAYTITQTASGVLTSGSNTIPGGACTVVPVYAAADNGGSALVGTLGTSGTWTATTAKTLYTSDASGSLRTIQNHYSITDDPAAGATASVPLTQPAGTYTGTVTFTATA